LRVQAGERPRDGDHRDVDAWKDVGRRAQDHERAHHENQERQDDERIGAAERESDDPHISAARSAFVDGGDHQATQIGPSGGEARAQPERSRRRRPPHVL